MEQYVYCEGGKPKQVFDNRLAALTRLTEDKFPLTQREMSEIKRAHDTGIAIGDSLVVVGYLENEGWERDRSLTRVR